MYLNVNIINIPYLPPLTHAIPIYQTPRKLGNVHITSYLDIYQ